MDPFLAELFDKLHRRFDAFEAKWSKRDAEAVRRVGVLEDIAETRAAHEQRAEDLRVGAPKRIEVDVRADNWGGLFEQSSLPSEEHGIDSAADDLPVSTDQERDEIPILSDNWGGLFDETAPDTTSSNSASPPLVGKQFDLDTAATEENEPKAIPLQIQERGKLEMVEADEKVLPSTGSEALKVAVSTLAPDPLAQSGRNVNMGGFAALRPPRIHRQRRAPPRSPRLCRLRRQRPSLRQPQRHPPRPPRPRRRRLAVLRLPRLHRQRRAPPRPTRLRGPRPAPPWRCGRRPRRAPPRPPWRCYPRSPRLRGLRPAPPRRREHQRWCTPPGPPWRRPDSRSMATLRAMPTRCSTWGLSHDAHVVIISGGKLCVHDFCIDVTDSAPAGTLARVTGLVHLDSTNAVRAVELSVTVHAEVQRHHIHPYKATACKEESDFSAWDAEADCASQLDRTMFAVFVAATGAKAERIVPDFAGARDFIGSAPHVSEYKCGEASHGKRVLVASGRNSDIGSCHVVLLLLLGELGIGNSLYAVIKDNDLDILVCCLAFCLGGYHAHGYSSNTEDCCVRKAKYVGVRLKLYSDGMIQLHAHLGRGYFVTTLLAWTVLLEARQSFEEKMNSMYLCFYRKPMANLLLVLTLEDPNFLGLLLCNSCLADWTPAKCSTQVSTSLECGFSASTTVSILGKLDQMLKRYITDFTHACPIGVDMFYLVYEIHGIQRVFGTWISQCPVQFWPFSALLVVKAPWSPYMLLVIKGDAVLLRPLPWLFFYGSTAPVQSKKHVPQHVLQLLLVVGKIQRNGYLIGGHTCDMFMFLLLYWLSSIGACSPVDLLYHLHLRGSVTIGDLSADEERGLLVTLYFGLLAVQYRPPWPPPNQLTIMQLVIKHTNGRFAYVFQLSGKPKENFLYHGDCFSACRVQQGIFVLVEGNNCLLIPVNGNRYQPGSSYVDPILSVLVCGALRYAYVVDQYVTTQLRVPWDPGGTEMSPSAWGQAEAQGGGNVRYHFIARCGIMLLVLGMDQCTLEFGKASGQEGVILLQVKRMVVTDGRTEQAEQGCVNVILLHIVHKIARVYKLVPDAERGFTELLKSRLLWWLMSAFQQKYPRSVQRLEVKPQFKEGGMSGTKPRWPKPSKVQQTPSPSQTGTWLQKAAAEVKSGINQNIRTITFTFTYCTVHLLPCSSLPSPCTRISGIE